MGPLEFSITRWAAWAPDLATPEAWEAWARLEAPRSPQGQATPPLSEVPAMARRRLERQGRLAAQVATWVQGEERGVPALFASRHGDPTRSVELLASLARGEPLSPTDFGLSVHNAIAGQYSMLRKDTANFSALAAGRTTVEGTFLEAAGLLAEGCPQVLVVVYDATLPSVYEGQLDEPEGDYAWAVRLEGPRAGLPRVRLSYVDEAAPGAGSALPHGLEVLRFLLAGHRLEYPSGPGSWRWTKHD